VWRCEAGCRGAKQSLEAEFRGGASLNNLTIFMNECNSFTENRGKVGHAGAEFLVARGRTSWWPGGKVFSLEAKFFSNSV
jgi:hypothetical protein